MSESPADLERAHARIAALERALGDAPEARGEGRWATTLRWCALAAAILLIAGAIAASIVLPGAEVVLRAPPPPPPKPIPAGELELVSSRFLWDTDGPALVDAEDKGSAHDLLLLAWRPDHADRALHVVAVRRGTHEVLWRSEGFPSGRRNTAVSLAATGGRVAVSDAHGDVHVLDVHTGQQLRVILASSSERLATLATDPNAVFALAPGLHASGRDQGTRRIDLVTGEVSESDLASGYFLDQCPVDRSRACRSEAPPAAKAKLARLVPDHGAEFSEDLVDDGDRITVIDTAPRPQLVDFQLFAWGADGTKLKWRAPAVPAPHQALQGAGSGAHWWLALANHRVVAIYLSGSKGHRASAHDAATGKMTYDVALPELPYGIEVERLTLDGDTGFIMTTGALFVLDATTGRVTTALRRF